LTAIRIKSLKIRGFRPCGVNEQTLVLGEIAAIWGPNSKGKTSLSEGFEFLLTGCISRRELMASSQDEFADSLRNAHLPAGAEVYVSAKITDSDGTDQELKRVLIADYGKKQECTSRLEINGVEATEADLARLGITLSQPPLRAPVLAQHTLSHIFSVRPQDRATYFKALFEVTDLDDIRNQVAGLATELGPPTDVVLSKFDICAAHPLLGPSLTMRVIPEAPALAGKLDDCARALLNSAGVDIPATPAERMVAVNDTLTELRSKAFPVKAFERKQLAGWNTPAESIWSQLETYLTERARVDEKTRQLVALFKEALKLPAVTEIKEDGCCPLCGTTAGLTPERVQTIRQHVADTGGFNAAETAAKAALAQLSAAASNLADSIERCVAAVLRGRTQQTAYEGVHSHAPPSSRWR
jgi:hypothetical protein